MEDVTRSTPEEKRLEPVKCVNNCGFFGLPENANMCSKCYNTVLSKKRKAEAEETTDTTPALTNRPLKLQKTQEIVTEKPSEPSSTPAGKPAESPAKKSLNRCEKCKKKVGLTGFTCRCGSLFCALHRLSTQHDCTFDYKAMAKAELEKSNPKLQASKLNAL